MKVKNVYFNVGDKVRKDQVLATLDSSDLDSIFNAAKSTLSLAQLNYNKAKASENKEFDLLKAQNDLIVAQNNLNNIETTIRIANDEEDNAIEKAEQSVKDAQKRYDDLTCTDCGEAAKDVRNKNNTFGSAVEDIRQTVTSIQSSIDALDKIMYYTDKYRLP